MEDCTKIDFDLTQFGDQTSREQITPRPSGSDIGPHAFRDNNVLTDAFQKPESARPSGEQEAQKPPNVHDTSELLKSQSKIQEVSLSFEIS